MNIRRKFIKTIACLLATLLFSASAMAYGPVMRESTEVVEEARITIEMTDKANIAGTLTAKLLECSGCIPKSYHFDSNTLLLNQFGAERPISELMNWSGNRAMFTFRKADGQVVKVQILP